MTKTKLNAFAALVLEFKKEYNATKHNGLVDMVLYAIWGCLSQGVNMDRLPNDIEKLVDQMSAHNDISIGWAMILRGISMELKNPHWIKFQELIGQGKTDEAMRVRYDALKWDEDLVACATTVEN